MLGLADFWQIKWRWLEWDVFPGISYKVFAFVWSSFDLKIFCSSPLLFRCVFIPPGDPRRTCGCSSNTQCFWVIIISSCASPSSSLGCETLELTGCCCALQKRAISCVIFWSTRQLERFHWRIFGSSGTVAFLAVFLLKRFFMPLLCICFRLAVC